MADVRERIDAELDQVQRILSRLSGVTACSRLSELELAGVAALLHGFYNGVENVLKQILREKGAGIPTGESWHRDLIALAASQGILTEKTAKGIRPYLAFRHFFSHAYAVDLVPDRIEPLVKEAPALFEQVQVDLAKALQK